MANWLTDRHLFLLAVLLYGVASIYAIFLWKRGFRRTDWTIYSLLSLAFVFQTFAMLKRGFSLAQCPVYNLFEAMMFIMWTIVAAYLVFGMVSRLRFLGAFASPILFGMGVFALMPALDPPHGPKPVFVGGLTSLHATLIFLSYGAFGLSCVASFMFLTQEHDLKFRKLRAILSKLPPIERLETVARRMVALGFVLLTTGLVFSFFLLKQRYGVYFRPDPEIYWSIFVWCLYLSLILLRWPFHRRGRLFAWGSIVSFFFVMLTFWGVSLLSPIHHP